jgi:hypothetical protein
MAHPFVDAAEAKEATMKKMHVLLFAMLMVSSGFSEEGWIPLFNGKDLTGWTFDTLDKAEPGTIWSVRDGTVMVQGKDRPSGVMRTEKSYSDYELEFEWRWPGLAGNSGCLIHCTDPREMNVWPKSVEVQLQSGSAGDFWLIGETIEVTPEQIVQGKDGLPGRRRLKLVDGCENPLGEWNRMHIVAKGETVEVYVNGTLVQKGWDASVSGGAICLQAERADIQFRNIRIRP